MLKVYSYIRFSSPEQAKGDSKSRQLQAVEEYAAKHGLEVDDSLKVDEGVSAYDGSNVKKGHLGKFLALLERGEIAKGSVLLVESLDRLSRQDIFGSLDIFYSIIRGGVKIVTLANGREYDEESIRRDPYELSSSLAILQRANEESEMKSKRISAAWEAKRQKAHEIPLSAICPQWLKLNRKKDEFEVIPERVDLINRIFSDSLSGKGQNTIARNLNLEGLEPWGRGNSKGTRWHESAVSRILGNRSLLGHFQPRKFVGGVRVSAGELLIDYFPQVIDEELFYEVQELRRKRRPVTKGETRKEHPANRNGKLSNLFTGFVKCGFCGSQMIHVSKGKNPTKGGRYLVCKDAKTGMGCEYVSVRYEVFERNFLSSFREIKISEFLETTNVKSLRSELTSDKNSTKGKLDETRKMLSNLTDALAKGRKNPQIVLDRISGLEEKESELKSHLEQLEGQIVDAGKVSESSANLKDMLATIFENLESLSEKELFDYRTNLRQALLRIVSHVTIFPRNKGIHFYQLELLEKKVKQTTDVTRMSAALALQLAMSDKWPKATADRPMVFSTKFVSGKESLFTCGDGTIAQFRKVDSRLVKSVLRKRP